MISPREYQAISPSRPDIERTGVHHWITSSADARSRVRPSGLPELPGGLLHRP